MHLQIADTGSMSVDDARHVLLNWLVPGKEKPGYVAVCRAIFVLIVWFLRGGDSLNVIGAPSLAMNDELAARKLAAIDGELTAVGASPLSAWWPLIEFLLRRLVDELSAHLATEVPKSTGIGGWSPLLRPILLNLAGKAFDWAAGQAPEIAEFRPLVMEFLEQLLAKESA